MALSANDQPARRRCHIRDSRRASSIVKVAAARPRMALTSCCSERALILARAFSRLTVFCTALQR
ncbi:MAG: hypothetical protein DMD79_16880 [Candidatus Rokuibacteriota bacterium]|nr:MAG: hypothetical protein DMD79_16880 [Candidatus Rokubacteria bacterium]